MVEPLVKVPKIKGWCPGALRPMESGDGWLVRIRAPGGVLTPVQAAGVARASLAYGNGVIDLSSRANLQLRGVRIAGHGALIDDLRALGLVDDDLAAEAARNVIVTPFGADPGVVAALMGAVAQLPALPGKFGFAVDTGAARVLADAPADIRLERDAAGGVILRPDGYAYGRAVGDLQRDVRALVHWFLETGGAPEGRGRMAAHVAHIALPPGFDVMPAVAVAQPLPGLRAGGALVGFAFGQMQADTLGRLAWLGHVMRITPWRMVLLVGADALPDGADLITTPDDPLLRVTACSGAPACAQGLGPTRALARMLAPDVATHLHVSGCAKGCAHAGPAAVTVVATGHGYNLIRGGKAADPPAMTDLSPALIAQALKVRHAPPV